MANLVSFVCGLVFGIGLIVSEMTNPAKIVAFLDLAGRWDPSLALVMVGAIAIAGGAFGLARRRPRSLPGRDLALTPRRDIDARLIGGSLAFGVGWGLAGFCPGPAIVALGAGIPKVAIFVGAMLVGMLAYEVVTRRRVSTPAE